MKRWLCLFAAMLFCRIAAAGEFTLENVPFAFRVPARSNMEPVLIVLFGGRNWNGKNTLATFRFDAVAEQNGAFLLSPGFVDRDYWEPEKWSGRLLLRAVAELEKRQRVRFRGVILYGYSAGGQCAALFANWMPQPPLAWGAHGCGVFPEKIRAIPVPALVTCGTEDAERFQISRNFLYRYREAGGALLWKTYPTGHELNPAALEIARVWIGAICSGEPVREWGEDDTGRIGDDHFDSEFRNPLYNAKIRELWLKP